MSGMSTPVMSTPVASTATAHRPLGYTAVFGLTTFVALGWLALGGVAALLRYWPGLLDPAAVTGGLQSVLVVAAEATGPRPSWPSTAC